MGIVKRKGWMLFISEYETKICRSRILTSQWSADVKGCNRDYPGRRREMVRTAWHRLTDERPALLWQGDGIKSVERRFWCRWWKGNLIWMAIFPFREVIRRNRSLKPDFPTSVGLYLQKRVPWIKYWFRKSRKFRNDNNNSSGLKVQSWLNFTICSPSL